MGDHTDAANPAIEVTQTEPVAGPSILWNRAEPYLWAALLTLCLLTVPFVNRENLGDLSYVAVLNYAHQHGLQFGTDLVCSYGPLGFLIFPFYASATGATTLLAHIPLCLVTLSGLCLAAWHLKRWARYAFLAIFTWAAVNCDRLDTLAETGIFCWALLCFLESGRRLTFAIIVLALLTAFLALAKVSYLYEGTLTICFLCTALIARRKSRSALLLAASFGLAAALCWLAAGQKLLSVWPFLFNSARVVSAYNQSMGLNGLRQIQHGGWGLLLVWGLAVLFAVLALWQARTKQPLLQSAGGAIALGWLAAIILMSWKHGFIVLDAYHSPAALVFMPVAALGFVLLNPGSARLIRSARIASALAAFLALCLLQWFFLTPPRYSLVQPFRALALNANILVHPASYRAQMEEQMDLTRAINQLPTLRSIIGTNTVDVFGQFLAVALDNNLNFVPRPALQSYAACSREMMRLDEEFYLSDRASEFVLFNWHAMAGRLGLLEDSWLLRHLLLNYTKVASEADYLLLRRHSRERCRLTLIDSTTLDASQRLNLSPWPNSNLWLEIRMRPSWTGRLKQLMYRPAKVRFEAWADAGKKLLVRRYAPAEMMAAGFLCSPLPLNQNDFDCLYEGKPVNRPDWVGIYLDPEDRSSWRKEVEFRVYRIENSLPGLPYSGG